MSDHDAATLAALMEAHPGVTLHFDAYYAFTLTAALQLSCRHPGVAGTGLDRVIHECVERISAGLGEPLAAIITAGWDPTLDVGPALG